MHRVLSVVLGIVAFLIVCLYWLWQMLSGEPALPLEEVALRAVVAMLAVWLLGRLLGRLGAALFSEAWHESHARERRRGGRAIPFGGGAEPASGEGPGRAER